MHYRQRVLAQIRLARKGQICDLQAVVRDLVKESHVRAQEAKEPRRSAVDIPVELLDLLYKADFHALFEVIHKVLLVLLRMRVATVPVVHASGT